MKINKYISFKYSHKILITCITVLNFNLFELEATNDDWKENSLISQKNIFQSFPNNITYNILESLSVRDLLKLTVVDKKLSHCANDIAKTWTREDFCLADCEQYDHSWVTTYTYYNILWRYSKDPEALFDLKKQNFYLGNIFEFSSFNKDQHIQKLLSLGLGPLFNLEKDFNENVLQKTLDHKSIEDTFMIIKYITDLIPSIVNGSIKYDELNLDKVLSFIKQLTHDAYKQIIDMGNTSFILLVKNKLFLLGNLGESKNILDLFIKAQITYKERFGFVHIGQIKHGFAVQPYEELRVKRLSYNFTHQSFDINYFSKEILNNIQ